jgi:hypothetical protein
MMKKNRPSENGRIGEDKNRRQSTALHTSAHTLMVRKEEGRINGMKTRRFPRASSQDMQIDACLADPNCPDVTGSPWMFLTIGEALLHL